MSNPNLDPNYPHKSKQKKDQKHLYSITFLLFLLASNMSSPPTLTYFDATGRANLTRLVFVAGNVEFIDQRVANWPEIKADPTSVPSKLFGQLPCIEHNGTMLAQSIALAFYAAELGIWKNMSAADRATDTMVLVTNDELKDVMLKCLFGDEESKKAGKEALQEKAGKLMAALEKMLERSPCEGPFFTSASGPTLADLAVFDNIENLLPGLKALDFDFSAYPKLVACAHAVGETEAIKNFVEKGWKL
jgi:glutathione S-transferase